MFWGAVVFIFLFGDPVARGVGGPFQTQDECESFLAAEITKHLADAPPNTQIVGACAAVELPPLKPQFKT